MSKLESRIVSGEDDEEDEEEEYSPSIHSQETRDFPRTGQPLIRPTLIPSTAIMFGPSKGNEEDEEEEDDEEDEKVRDSGEVKSNAQKPDEKTLKDSIPTNTASEGIASDYKADEGDNVAEHDSSVRVSPNTSVESKNPHHQQQEQPLQHTESHAHEKIKVEPASAVQKKPNNTQTVKPNMTSWFKSEISYFLGHGNSHSSVQKPKGELSNKADLGTMVHLEPSANPSANHTHQHQHQHRVSLGSSAETEKDSSLASLEEKDDRFSQDGDMQTGSDICPEDASHMHQSIEDANGATQAKAARNDLTSHYLTASTKALASSLWKGAMTVKKLSGFDSNPAPLPPYVQVSFVDSDATPLEKANHNYYDCLSTAHAKFYYDMGMCASGLLKIGDNTVVGLDKTRTHRRLAISDLRSLSQSCDEVDFVLRLNYLNKSDVPSRGTSVSTL